MNLFLWYIYPDQSFLIANFIGAYDILFSSKSESLQRWENVCPNGAQREAACDDKSDQDHCDSDFFDYFEFIDENWNGDYSEYLNMTRIFGEAANQIDKDTLRRVIKHRYII